MGNTYQRKGAYVMDRSEEVVKHLHEKGIEATIVHHIHDETFISIENYDSDIIGEYIKIMCKDAKIEPIFLPPEFGRRTRYDERINPEIFANLAKQLKYLAGGNNEHQD